MIEPRAWSGCRYEIRDAAGHTLQTDDDCDVRLEGDSMVLSYFDDEGALVFSGLRESDESFDLWCRGRVRRARLRFDASGERLEGEWTEDEAGGSWSVELGRGSLVAS